MNVASEEILVKDRRSSTGRSSVGDDLLEKLSKAGLSEDLIEQVRKELVVRDEAYRELEEKYNKLKEKARETSSDLFDTKHRLWKSEWIRTHDD